MTDKPINDVLLGSARWGAQCCDCLDFTRSLPDKCVDLVLCSPPYEAARTYGVGFNLKGQDWVDWCVERFVECCRICKGLVAWVVEGQTRGYRYSAAPALLMADLHRRGVNLRKPPVFYRVGIPGSGGPDWLRNDWEWIICATQTGRLPWSDNKAMGHKPKHAPGGELSYRHADGQRVNAQLSKAQTRRKPKGERARDGVYRAPGYGKMAMQVTADGAEPKVANALANGMKPGAKLHTKNNGNGMRVQCYTPPDNANPGNVIKCKVGGGLMGSDLAHENEAPYPEKLAEFFVLSFCPPDGIVYDPFSGSGTTAAVSLRHKRRFIGTDVRQSQVDLTKRRIAEVQLDLFAEVQP